MIVDIVSLLHKPSIRCGIM